MLSDPNKRAQYDRFGSVGNGMDGGGFGELRLGRFRRYLRHVLRCGNGGGAAERRRSGPARGSDLRYDMEITLEEAFAGTTKEIAFAPRAMRDCKGNGAAPNSLIVPCDRCQGTGAMRQVRQTPLGQFVTQAACTTCNGEGHASPNRARRAAVAAVTNRAQLSVKMPAGVDDGSRIRIPGSGEAGIRGGAGDLFVYLTCPQHRIFGAKGSTRSSTCRSPPCRPRSARPSGSVARRRSAGRGAGRYPDRHDHASARARYADRARQQRGDHHVTVHVVVPSKSNKRQRELLEEYARAGGDAIEEKSFFDRVKDAFKARSEQARARAILSRGYARGRRRGRARRERRPQGRPSFGCAMATRSKRSTRARPAFARPSGSTDRSCAFS